MSDLVQLMPGRLAPSTKVLELDSIRLRRVVYNLGIRETFDSQGGLILAYLHRQCGLARLGGELWFNRSLAMLFGRAEFSTTEACILTLIEVDSERIPILSQFLACRSRSDERFAIVPADMKLQDRVDGMFLAGECSGTSEQRKLLASIIRVVDEVMKSHGRSRMQEQLQRRAVAGAAEAYMWSHIDDDFSLESICRGIGCGPRTLIGYFHRLYGMGPIHYLKILRLNRVRSALIAGDSQVSTVFDMAADQGFWHMGHFSSSYRLIYGETPFETLHGPA